MLHAFQLKNPLLLKIWGYFCCIICKESCVPQKQSKKLIQKIIVSDLHKHNEIYKRTKVETNLFHKIRISSLISCWLINMHMGHLICGFLKLLIVICAYKSTNVCFSTLSALAIRLQNTFSQMPMLLWPICAVDLRTFWRKLFYLFSQLCNKHISIPYPLLLQVSTSYSLSLSALSTTHRISDMFCMLGWLQTSESWMLQI